MIHTYQISANTLFPNMPLTFIHTSWFGQRVPTSLGSFSHISHSSYFTLHCNSSFSVANITNHSQITSNVSSCYKTYSIYALCFYITHNQQTMTTSATVNSQHRRSHPSIYIHDLLLTFTLYDHRTDKQLDDLCVHAAVNTMIAEFSYVRCRIHYTTVPRTIPTTIAYQLQPPVENSMAVT